MRSYFSNVIFENKEKFEILPNLLTIPKNENLIFPPSPNLSIKAKMPTLYLLRHDRKAWPNNRRPRHIPGHQHDPPLANPTTPSSQMLESLQRLSEITFQGIYCSPFLRTRQTLELVQGFRLEGTATAKLRKLQYLRQSQQLHLFPVISSHS
jgi:hypothetical protein